MHPSEALVRAYYDAFNRGDWEGMCALLAPDVVHDVSQGGRELGVAAFRAFLARMAVCYREELRDLVVMLDPSGARAAAEFTVHGAYVADDAGMPPARGQVYVLQAGAFLELRGGSIVRVSMHYNLQDWLAQVA
jgi:steroid delta-isomerase-like uncharacterized protein